MDSKVDATLRINYLPPILRNFAILGSASRPQCRARATQVWSDRHAPVVEDFR